jgi:hypothetical protein
MSEDWKPGIVVLKDTALYEPRIERLGPPPGNAEILIRGGAGWVFGIEERVIDPRIVRRQDQPTLDDVVIAVAREMAWRWFNGKAPFVKSAGTEQGVSRMARKFHRYADLEKGFVEQALNLIPKMSSRSGPGLSELVDTTGAVANSGACACLDGTTCCATGCLNCQEE